MKQLILLAVVAAIVLPASGRAEYLPAMPPGTGMFGTAIAASVTFQDGYHWDDPATPIDERDIPEHYGMPSPMPGYTAGDALDYHWVWVDRLGDHVTWDMSLPVWSVRVYPSQDHGPYTGPNSEFDEYRVWGSNDMSTWTEAVEIAMYCDDINNVKTHDGVKDYRFDAPCRYCRITSWIDSDFELDAVEVMRLEVNIDIKPQSCPNPLNVKMFKDKGSLEDAGVLGAVAKIGPRVAPPPDAVLPAAVLGSASFDVTSIDAATVILAGVPVLRWSYEDIATPMAPGSDMCACHDMGPDGYMDLTLKFRVADLISVLGQVHDGDVIPLLLTGLLDAGGEFEGSDCVVIRGDYSGGDGLASPNQDGYDLTNYPNPFNPMTEIMFTLAEAGHVSLVVYNVTGQKVVTLVNNWCEAGTHRVIWNGSGAPSGVYFYRLQAGDFVGVRKMLMLK